MLLSSGPAAPSPRDFDGPGPCKGELVLIDFGVIRRATARHHPHGLPGRADALSGALRLSGRPSNGR